MSCKTNSLRANLRITAGKFGSLPRAPAGNWQGIADNALPRRGRPPQGNEKQTHLSAFQNPIKGIILTRKLAFCGALYRNCGIDAPEGLRLMLRHRRGLVALFLQALVVIPSGLAWAQAPGGAAHFYTTLRGIHVAGYRGSFACPGDAVSGWGFAVLGPGHPEEATCSGPSINYRRRFRTVDRINKPQVYRGYRVTEVVNSFPEHSNNSIPHKAYPSLRREDEQNTVLEAHFPGLAIAVLIN